jgi:hypothetical protein
MENDHWFRNEVLEKYESGVLVFLVLVAAAFLGVILWIGYSILL